MSREALWLATCLLGLAVTGVAIVLGRREHLTNRVRALIWIGPALVLLGGYNALTGADLSRRAQGLWLYGAVALAALSVAALAGRPDQAPLRRGNLMGAAVFVVMLVLTLFDHNPLDGLFHR